MKNTTIFFFFYLAGEMLLRIPRPDLTGSVGRGYVGLALFNGPLKPQRVS